MAPPELASKKMHHGTMSPIQRKNLAPPSALPRGPTYQKEAHFFTRAIAPAGLRSARLGRAFLSGVGRTICSGEGTARTGTPRRVAVVATCGCAAFDPSLTKSCPTSPFSSMSATDPPFFFFAPPASSGQGRDTSSTSPGRPFVVPSRAKNLFVEEVSRSASKACGAARPSQSLKSGARPVNLDPRPSPSSGGRILRRPTDRGIAPPETIGRTAWLAESSASNGVGRDACNGCVRTQHSGLRPRGGRPTEFVMCPPLPPDIVAAFDRHT